MAKDPERARAARSRYRKRHPLPSSAPHPTGVPAPAVRGTPAERAWAKVQRGGPNECWPFIGSRNRDGYGRIGFRGRPALSAHRVIYEDLHGPLPPGVVVRHSCDNPPCCNPAHLLRGAQADNVRDRNERGRGRWRRGADHAQAIDPAVAAAVRERYVRGVTRQVDVAAEFGISQRLVSLIVRGEHWSTP